MFSMLLTILTTSFGRYLLIGGVCLALLAGAYYKVRADAWAEIEADAKADVLRRTQDALSAGDAIIITPDRLRESDGNARY